MDGAAEDDGKLGVLKGEADLVGEGEALRDWRRPGRCSRGWRCGVGRGRRVE